MKKVFKTLSEEQLQNTNGGYRKYSYVTDAIVKVCRKIFS